MQMRWEKTEQRDLTYSRWHRQFTGEYRFIDIDHVEYCPYCNEPLALIETARDVGQTYKCAEITTLIAKKIGVFSLIVLYKVNESGEIINFRVKYTNPNGYDYLNYSPMDYLKLLKKLHDLHNKNKCKKYCGGGDPFVSCGTNDLSNVEDFM